MADKPSPSPNQDGSIWGDLARMEAEVVDPEEEKTAHYDYNAIREKLKALDPEALAAAEAMFDEDEDDNEDEPATVMAPQEPATVMAQRSPPRPGRGAIPGIRRPVPQPAAIPPAPESHPGTESLLDDDDEPATAIVGNADVDRMRAAMNAKIREAIGAVSDEDDFGEDEPTRVADPGQAEAAMRLLAEGEAQQRQARAAGPQGAPPSGPERARNAPPPTPALTPEAQAPQAQAPQAQAPFVPPADDAEGQDLVQLLERQRKKDTLMYVLAALLFAIGIGVWLFNQ
ncbi:MAG TPA: hypothetical protein ENK57_07630 [Polyangiaceae bacterium]|nr:hypothetical protein [Polyangiaceae bacterium]